ncbi:MAG TPA: TetR family transcriptional regulator [Solirubrobacterales bacterium]|nr:TetR family transcriptional regulator [Solirubrobacterales bacterium]
MARTKAQAPKQRDAEATKARILAAATSEFAERGLAGARVDAIAERAHANKQLIYAYFGSKEKLFGAVLRNQIHELVEEVEIDPEHFAEYAGRVFDWHAEHPDLVRLLLHEGLEYGTGPVPGDEARAEHSRRKVEAVRAEQKRGGMDDSLDARDLVMLVIALATAGDALPQLARMTEGADPSSPRARSRRRAAAVEIVRRAATRGP